jgi:DNA adenine methylase
LENNAVLFRYPGGKSKSNVAKTILSFFPNEYDEMRDCMVGGGGIFWKIPPNKKRWINDLDTALISVYTAFRDRPQQFIELCRSIPAQSKIEEYVPCGPVGKKLICKRLRDKFNELAWNEDCNQALRYFFLNRTIWMGRVKYDWPEGCKRSRVYCSCSEGWNIVNTDKLEKAAALLKDVKITNTSYEVLLNEPGASVVCYLDPPYFKDTQLSRTNKLYTHNFSVDDHAALAANVRRCVHKVVLSYDDNQFIRDLYSWANVHSKEWTYCITATTECKDKAKPTGKELIITNF